MSTSTMTKNEKISRSLEGNTPWNKGLTKETDERVNGVSKKLKGGSIPIKQKQKMSDVKLKLYKEKGNIIGFQKGNTLGTVNKGAKRPYAAKSLPHYKGHEHYNWIEDRSFLIYPDEWTDILRQAIRQRDNYICQECGTHQDELDKKLDVHHIDYDKDNCDPANSIALCRKCHIKTNYNREYWINYFKNV